MRGHQPRHAGKSTSKRCCSSSPRPNRHPPSSPASSYASALPIIPAIGKWNITGLRTALSERDIFFSKQMTNAELYGLNASLPPLISDLKPLVAMDPHRAQDSLRAKSGPTTSADRDAATGHQQVWAATQVSHRRCQLISSSVGKTGQFLLPCTTTASEACAGLQQCFLVISTPSTSLLEQLRLPPQARGQRLCNFSAFFGVRSPHAFKFSGSPTIIHPPSISSKMKQHYCTFLHQRRPHFQLLLCRSRRHAFRS